MIISRTLATALWQSSSSSHSAVAETEELWIVAREPLLAMQQVDRLPLPRLKPGGFRIDGC